MEEENKLIVRVVPFMGDELMAAKDGKTGKIYAGIRWMCDGIGLTEGQSKSERLRIQNDVVLSKGGRNLVLPTKGGMQEIQCIDNEFVPLWLAKISITPAMQREQPEVADKLVQYQLKAAKVLADAFSPNPTTLDLPRTYPEALRALADKVEENEAQRHRMEADRPKVAFAEICAKSEGTVLVRELAKIASKQGICIGQNRLYRKLRDWGMVMQNSTEPTQEAVDRGYLEVSQGMAEASGTFFPYHTTRVTMSGQIYITGRLRDEAGAALPAEKSKKPRNGKAA